MNKQLFILMSIGTSMVAMEAPRPLNRVMRAQRETVEAFETMENELAGVKARGREQVIARLVLQRKLREAQIVSGKETLECLKVERDFQKSKKLLMYSWIGAPFIGIITYLLGRSVH